MPDGLQVGGTHYSSLSIDIWDALRVWLTPEEYIGFLKGNIIKYLGRKKNPDDADKAAHYMRELTLFLQSRKEKPVE